ncbi:hypothetical protein [Planctomicrobium sp. SH664]|uniref:hypothetical protein n=1 Tax=Planctomicrobium sp. SH664 TaxID=3448125 RepID=UPI003F5C3B84
MTHESSSTSTSCSPSQSGKWVVAGMLAFGVSMVGGLYLYSYFYSLPFRTLRHQVAVRYPHSEPNIVGGRYKSHEAGHPATLRMIVQIAPAEFNPEADLDQCQTRALELARLVFAQQDVSPYEVLEVHLVQRTGEEQERRWSAIHSLEEWRAALGQPPAEVPQN